MSGSASARWVRAIRFITGVMCTAGTLGLWLPEAQAQALGATGPAARILTADADSAGFERVLAPRPFVFPRDHGPHGGYRSEWWYFTGQLATAEKRRFGFQLTFFRFALVPQAMPRSSRWAARDIYMAHFAVTDVETETFHAFEHFARGAVRLAGADATPFRVWVEGWEAASTGSAFLPLRLRAARGAVALEIMLHPGKPYVAQGDAGFSAKSDRPGYASHYYSFTRLPAAGSLHVDGLEHQVTGNAWLDREWSTSALTPEQAGWDWFAFHLDDGRELMFYRFRRRDGAADHASAGVIVDRDGGVQRLAAGDVVLEVLDTWTSPGGDAVYPQRWSIRVPAFALGFKVEPLIDDQEHRGRFRYWEGAVRVHGDAGSSVGGSGYMELVGYAP